MTRNTPHLARALAVLLLTFAHLQVLTRTPAPTSAWANAPATCALVRVEYHPPAAQALIKNARMNGGWYRIMSCGGVRVREAIP